MDTGEGTAAETDGADGANGVILGDADEGTMRFPIDGHLGNDGYAHAGAYHAEQAAELTTFKNYLGMEARAITGGDGIFAETMAVAQEKERLRAKILEGKVLETREPVFFWQNGEKALRENGEGFKFVAADGESKNGEIDGVGAEAFEEDRGDFLNDRKMHLRKFSGENGEVRRQKVRRDRRNDAEAKGTAAGVFMLGDIAACGFEFAKDSAGPGEKGFAKFGQANGTAETVEEAAAEFVLEFSNLLGEGGLRDVGPLCAAAEATGIGDGAEVAELVEFHQQISRRGLPRRHREHWEKKGERTSTIRGVVSIGYAYPFYPNYILDV